MEKVLITLWRFVMKKGPKDHRTTSFYLASLDAFAFAQRCYFRWELRGVVNKLRSQDSKKYQNLIEEYYKDDEVFWGKVFGKIDGFLKSKKNLTSDRLSYKQRSTLYRAAENVAIDHGLDFSGSSKIILSMIYALPDFISSLDAKVKAENVRKKLQEKMEPEDKSKLVKQAQDLLEQEAFFRERGTLWVSRSCEGEREREETIGIVERIAACYEKEKSDPEKEGKIFPEEEMEIKGETSTSQFFQAFFEDREGGKS